MKVNAYEFISKKKKCDFCVSEDLFITDYDEGFLRYLYDTDIIIDDDMLDYRSKARRPYYQMRGRRITKEQAFEIIRRTDSDAPWYDCGCCDDYVGSMNFQNWWTVPHLPSYYGWVHPDGTVGSDALTQKYPCIKEFVEEWLRNIYYFPFLELAVAISTWNEVPPYAYDNFKQYMFTPYTDFFDNIDAGILVHDGKLEIMSSERTVKKYMEYEDKYSENDHRVYRPEYYTELCPNKIDTELALKCFRYYGVENIPEDAFSSGGGFVVSRLKAVLEGDN